MSSRLSGTAQAVRCRGTIGLALFRYFQVGEVTFRQSLSDDERLPIVTASKISHFLIIYAVSTHTSKHLQPSVNGVLHID